MRAQLGSFQPPRINDSSMRPYLGKGTSIESFLPRSVQSLKLSVSLLLTRRAL
jgi:hypothetical protein